MSPSVAFLLGIAFAFFLFVIYGAVAMASNEQAKMDAEDEARERRAARMRWTPPAEPDEAETGC
jgi:hypothetical protein